MSSYPEFLTNGPHSTVQAVGRLGSVKPTLMEVLNTFLLPIQTFSALTAYLLLLVSVRSSGCHEAGGNASGQEESDTDRH